MVNTASGHRPRDSLRDGQVHTNGWRTSGTPEARHQRNLREGRAYHLFRYVDEQAFRFNKRQT